MQAIYLKLHAVIVCFCFLQLLVACSPTGGSFERVDLDNLAGLWNSSERVNGKTDTMYTRISRDGSILEYDYDGDNVDGGLDCYQIDSGWIRPLQANRFLVTADMHANRKFEVELEFLDAGHALQVVFHGPSGILKTQIWTRVHDDSLLANEPSCRVTG